MIRGLLLEWVPWIFNKASDIFDYSNRIIQAAYTEATVEKEWIFLNSYDIPLVSSYFPNIPSEQIRWRVKTNPLIFLRTDLSNETLKHISYLGLSIILPDIDPIDLTDWINDVKWSGAIQPTPSELFIVWCCETGSPYFHLISQAKIELITEDGNFISKEL